MTDPKYLEQLTTDILKNLAFEKRAIFMNADLSNLQKNIKALALDKQSVNILNAHKEYLKSIKEEEVLSASFDQLVAEEKANIAIGKAHKESDPIVNFGNPANLLDNHKIAHH